MKINYTYWNQNYKQPNIGNSLRFIDSSSIKPKNKLKMIAGPKFL